MREYLSYPLYHGTSSLFLDSILTNGLAGINPVIDWKVIDLAAEVLRIYKDNLSSNEDFLYLFEKMVRQEGGRFNMQHGDTYLSASIYTAAKYAANSRFGSELLTQTMLYLEKLISKEVPGLDELSPQFDQLTSLISTNPSPILIEVSDISSVDLIAEDGGDPTENLELVEKALNQRDPLAQIHIQQCNFRLREKIPVERLKFYMVTEPEQPEYKLYKLNSLEPPKTASP
jgi:hypothetical protein